MFRVCNVKLSLMYFAISLAPSLFIPHLFMFRTFKMGKFGKAFAKKSFLFHEKRFVLKLDELN